MISKDTLFVATQSRGRMALLKNAGFNFSTLSHTSDERSIEFKGDFSQYILAIAKDKMQKVVLPDNIKQENIFVLTADTMTMNMVTQEIYGKPRDYADAYRMLKAKQKATINVTTACYLQRREKNKNSWDLKAEKEWVNASQVEFHVPDNMIDVYLKTVPEAMFSCGAGVIGGFGANFTKSIHGSYESVVGLPIYDLRQALTDLSFNF